MKSIRVFLVIAVLSVMTLTSFVTALYGYRSGTATAEALFDQQLQDTAILISSLYESRGDTRQARLGSRLVFQLWPDTGTLALSSPGAPTVPIAPFLEGFHEENFNQSRWRILVTRAARDRYWLMVAEPAERRYQMADRVSMQTVVAVVIGLPAAGLLIWMVVGQGLLYLRQLATELSTKQAGDLSPLDVQDPPRELAVVVGAINSLLGRLSLSLARERRLTADAAHELRTPISALKIHLHNLAARLSVDDPALGHLSGEVQRLEHLVEQILMLYRITPEHYQARMEPVDLTEISRQAVADRYGEFSRKKQSISLRGAPQWITGDRFALSVLVQNLLSNAHKYTPEHGSVLVCVEPARGSVVLSVIDSGPGIPESERPRVLERFYRVGGDRHEPTVSGSGLGLSIVQLIAELHGAELRLGDAPGGSGLRIDVLFPDEQTRAVRTLADGT